MGSVSKFRSIHQLCVEKNISLPRPLCCELNDKTINIFTYSYYLPYIDNNKHLRINLGLQPTYREMGSVSKFRSIYQLCVEKISAYHAPFAMSYIIRHFYSYSLPYIENTIIIKHLGINLGLQATYREMGSVSKFRSIYQLCIEKY